jgi:hypothetical protein
METGAMPNKPPESSWAWNRNNLRRWLTSFVFYEISQNFPILSKQRFLQKNVGVKIFKLFFPC